MSNSSRAPVVEVLDEQLWDDEAEVVVVGTGIAGCSVAVNCADLGASVLILEKSIARRRHERQGRRRHDDPQQPLHAGRRAAGSA